VVKQSPSDKEIDWGKVNQPTTAAVFDDLYGRVTARLNEAPQLFVFDGYALPMLPHCASPRRCHDPPASVAVRIPAVATPQRGIVRAGTPQSWRFPAP
jgi:hypothetical protein